MEKMLEERDKVLKRMECIVSHKNELVSDCVRDNCPYAGTECDERVIRDAIPFVRDYKMINQDTSDGYHTFKELYHHRAVLFSVIVAVYSDRAWKSFKHSDGTMYDGMFIVGIETPKGQATYHYDKEYWDMFRCREVDYAPEWDGHTSDEAIERIGSLRYVGKSFMPVY